MWRGRLLLSTFRVMSLRRKVFSSGGWTTRDAPLYLIIILSAAVGAILAILALLPAIGRKRRELAEARDAIEHLKDAADGRAFDEKPPLEENQP